MPIVIVLFVSQLQASETRSQEIGDCYSTRWPHELSSLEPDPSLYFGRLENGFRYVLKTNTEPHDRVGIFLNVEAGSLYEQESERGLAHFLEHMVFNGSTHFKPGELVDYFQSIGMSFGGDTNAYTTYTETVYKIILPGGSKKEIDQGFLVIADYAEGALLLDQEVDRERGVILAEKTARDSAGYRSQLARSSFLMRNTLLPERQPIGTEEVLLSAGDDELKSFYNTWYRPDNMILVVVGDFDMDTVQNLVEERFADLQSSATGTCPEYGLVDHQGIETFYHYEPELGVTQVYIENIRNKESENDSLVKQKEDIQGFMASMIVNYRLSQLTENVATPFSSAGYYDTIVLDRYELAGIRAVTKKESWRETLAQIDETLRQVLTFGFSKKEVERVQNELLTELKNAVLASETRNSMSLATQIIGSLNKNRVFQTPQQESELYGPIISQTTVDDLNQIVRHSWQGDTRLVQVVGDAVANDENMQLVIKDYYEDIGGKEVVRPVTETRVDFPYLDIPNQRVKPLRVVALEDLGATRYEYSNGLVLNLKKTEFKDNSIMVALHFGSGMNAIPKNGLNLAASALLNGSGTARLKKSQLEEALSGSSVSYSFRITDRSLVIQGRSATPDIELLLQLLQTLILDPGFRPDVFQVSMKNIESMYRRLEQSVQGKASLELDSFFTGNAKGSGLPSWNEFKTITRDEIVNWLKPSFEKADLELSIVGDIDPERVEALASTYFGGLPKRTKTQDPQPEAIFPVGSELGVKVETEIDKALIRYGWLTDDDTDIHRSRRLHVLAAVFEERLRLLIREQLGQSYSPSAYSVTSRIFPRYGALFGEVIVNGQSLESTKAAIADVAASFSEKPVTDEDLLRAKEPILTSLKDTLRTNGYWLNSVLSLSSRNEAQLQWPLDIIADFSSISADEINQLATMYISDDRRAIGIVEPAGK